MPSFTSPRFSLSLLRAVIREAAFTAKDAPDGLALAVLDDGSEKTYMLYSTNLILQAIETWKEEVIPEAEKRTARYVKGLSAPMKEVMAKDPDFVQSYLDSAIDEAVGSRAREAWVGGKGVRDKVGSGELPVLGMISVSPNSQEESPQWGAATIKLAAAEPGWGPLLYDIVMSAEGGIISDRDSVSGAARGVWKYYKDSRPDVEAKPLDNARHPRTRVKKDDVDGWFADRSVKGEPPTNPLNYAYFSGKKPPMGSLKANHRKAKAILDRYRIPLYSMADLYFSVRYRGG